MSSIKIMLIRHSVTEGNLQRRYVGVTDESLCQAGLATAQQAAVKLPLSPEKVYCSPLKRCIQTADILFPDAEKAIQPLLRECDFGIFEGKTHAELTNDPDYIRWVASEGSFTPPGGESGADAQKRCLDGFSHIIADVRLCGLKTAAAVTHGGVIMRIMSHLFGGGIYNWQPENCGGFLLTINGSETEFQRISVTSDGIADDIAQIL